MLEVDCVPSVPKQIDAIPVGMVSGFPALRAHVWWISSCRLLLAWLFLSAVVFVVAYVFLQWNGVFLPCYKLWLHLLFRPLAGP